MNSYQAFEKFLIYLRIHKQCSDRTLEQYGRHILAFLSHHHALSSKIFNIRDFLRTLVSKPSDISKNDSESKEKMQKSFSRQINKINLEEINNFRFFLAQSDISLKTINAYMISLRAFFQFIKKQNIDLIFDPSDIDLAKQQSRKVDFLEPEELSEIISDIDTSDIMGQRDRAIIEMIYSTGLRISELTSLNISDVNLEKQEFIIRGKGGSIRIVYLTDWSIKSLQNYLSLRADIFQPLFIRHNLKNTDIMDDEKMRMSRYNITKMIQKRAQKSGILKHVSAHTLRHSFATTLLQNGADIRAIQELLGHKNIATTQVYTHVTNKKLKEIHKKFHS